MNRVLQPLVEGPIDAPDTPQLLLLAQPSKSRVVVADRVAERDELQSPWQNGEVIIFEETGHFIQGERLEEFIATVQRWLKTAIPGGY